jgi:hypothetical protein
VLKAPELLVVAPLYLTLFRFDVPRTVFLSTVIKCWALFVLVRAQDPGGVNVS